MHRSFRSVWITSMTVILVACQAASPPAGTPTGAPPATQTSAPSDTAAPPGEPIRIGAAMALTGDFSPDTKLVRDGYDFWVKKTNEAGGINVGGTQRPVELIVRDDGSDREQSARLLEQLIAEDNVDLILAPWGSGNTNAVAPISERYERVMIAPLASSDSIWEQGYEFLFGILPIASDNSRPTVEMAHELGVTRIAIVTTDDLFPSLAHTGAVDEAEKLGMEVVVNEVYPPGSLDVGPLVTQLQEAEPEFIINPADVADAVVFIRQMKERGYVPPGLAFSGATFVPDFLNNVGTDAENVFGITHWFPGLPREDDLFGTAQQYADEFEAFKGYVPTHDSSAASIAGYVLQLAVEEAGSLDQTAIRDALRAMDIETVFGPINFQDSGVNTGQEYVIQIHDGVSVPVFPLDIAEGEIVYPTTQWGGGE